ncbi:MAG: hypothetical protein VXZ45_02375 [Verrucomicrobiota bacterium]|nr:hypothetical protein [Verrucomicrobiota bacterium]
MKNNKSIKLDSSKLLGFTSSPKVGGKIILAPKPLQPKVGAKVGQKVLV